MARRLLAWQPLCAPLWFALSRVLCAVDPGDEAEEVVRELEADRSELVLLNSLGEDDRPLAPGPGGRDAAAGARPARDLSDATVVVLDAMALGPTGALAGTPAGALVDGARRRGVPVWLVVGVGAVVHPSLWDVMVSLHGRGDVRWPLTTGGWWDGGEAVLPDLLALVDVSRVAGPGGLEDVSAALARPPPPPPPELLAAAQADAFQERGWEPRPPTGPGPPTEVGAPRVTFDSDAPTSGGWGA